VLLDPPVPPPADPGGDPSSPAPVFPGWCRVVARTGAVVIPVCVVPVALLGAVATPAWAMATLSPLLGLFVAGAVLTVDPGSPGPARRRTGVLAAVAGAVSVPFVVGLGLLGGVGLAVTLLLFLLGPFLAAEWLLGTAGSGAAAGWLAQVTPVVASLPTDRLLSAWGTTEEVLRWRPAAGDRAAAVALRAALLDELARRDPEGVERWLRVGDGPPDRHIRADSRG
jgi:hypothetical protein